MAEVDKDLCISCGLCAQTCPEVFEMDDDDLAQVIDGGDTSADCVQDAADECPVEAISV